MKTPTLAIGALALLALAACGGASATTATMPPPAPTTAVAAVTDAPAPSTTPAPVDPTAVPASTPALAPVPSDPAPTPTTAPPPTPAPATTAPAPAPADAVVVTQVIDGDTIVVGDGDHVRFIGIDTPEKGRCGYEAATQHMRDLVAGKAVVLTAGARDDVDKYGRLLRYVDLPDGTDTGLAQIVGGFAIARYDSRDGYGHHDREEQYVAADTGAAAPCIGSPGAASTRRRPPAPRPARPPRHRRPARCTTPTAPPLGPPAPRRCTPATPATAPAWTGTTTGWPASRPQLLDGAG